MAQAVGTVRVNFQGGTGGLDTSADAAAAKIEAFGGSATMAGGSFVKFNAHMLESRKVLGTLAATAGTSVGPLLHIAHALGSFGIYAGAAIGTFMVLREVINSQTEALIKNTEHVNKFHEAWMKTNLSNIGAANKIATDELNKQLDAMRAINEISSLKSGPYGKIEGAILDWYQGTSKALEQAKAEKTRLDALYTSLTKGGKAPGEDHGHGGGMSHVLKAASGGQLGVLRLEHSGRDPNTYLLQQILVEEKKGNNKHAYTAGVP